MDLARKILDARLKLTRLRQAYPQPRLTVPSAEAQLDTQVLEMQTLGDKVQTLNEDTDSLKEKVKSGAREVERLRVERGEVEKLVKQSKSEEEDARVMQLYDWYVHCCWSVHKYAERWQVHGCAQVPSESALAGLVHVTLGERASSCLCCAITARESYVASSDHHPALRPKHTAARGCTGVRSAL